MILIATTVRAFDRLLKMVMFVFLLYYAIYDFRSERGNGHCKTIPVDVCRRNFDPRKKKKTISNF